VRRFPVAIGGALLVLVLSGCGNEAGPAPKRGGEPGPDALPTKLTALTVDQCYASPRTQLPKGCEKYVTELGSVPGELVRLTMDMAPEITLSCESLEADLALMKRAASSDRALGREMLRVLAAA